MKSLVWSAALVAALLAAGTACAHKSPDCATSLETPRKKVKLGGLLSSLRTVSNVAGMDGERGPVGVASTLASGADIVATGGGGGKKCADEKNAVQPRTLAAVRGEAVVPTTASIQKYERVADIPDPAGFAEAKAALDAFGKYQCAACEGGFGYDSWVDANISGLQGKSVAEKVATMKVGEALHWKGRISTGTLTVVGADPVGGIECRQVKIRLVKGQQSAERPGLYCKGGFKWLEAY